MKKTASLLSFLVIGLALPSSCGALRSRSLTTLQLPKGFSIASFATVPGARSMVLGAKGTLFVGTREGRGAVYAIAGARDLSPKPPVKIVDDLAMPNGVAFRDGALYVAEVSRILRFDGIEDALAAPPRPMVVRDDFPTDTHHGWKVIAFGPDGWLYVPVGAPCNVCDKPASSRYASITRMKPDGSAVEVFARGIRNTVGFDWNPETKELWFTENGRDWLGDDRPPDELNRAPKAGLHFGFPYCHGGTILDGEYGKGHACSEFTPPERNLDPHVAALGMKFYRGSMFPPEYRGQIFIAEHGSWNRSRKIGYRVMLVRLKGGKAVSYEPFLTGFLTGESEWGRPVDLLELPDGSLLLSDDEAGAIYRITYAK